MRIDGHDGEFLFQAMYKHNGAWELSSVYFASLEEASEYYKNLVPKEFRWPVIRDEVYKAMYHSLLSEIQ